MLDPLALPGSVSATMPPGIQPSAQLVARRTADEHPVLVYLARLAPGSRRTMRQSLDTIAGIVSNGQANALTLDWARLGYQHTAAVRAILAEQFAPSTVNKMLAALRGVLKEVWRLGQLDAETYHRVVDLASVRGERLLRGRQVATGELRALFRACQDDPTPSGCRDAALLAVLYGGGLRRAEAVSLDLAHYDRAASALTVRGKGNKERLVYLSTGAVIALDAWIRLRGPSAGPLFVPINRGGRLGQRRLSDQAVLVVLQKRVALAGVRSCSPHDLRRTAASDLFDAGVDVGVVRRILGHANVETTLRYDRRGEAAKQRAATMLHVPITE